MLGRAAPIGALLGVALAGAAAAGEGIDRLDPQFPRESAALYQVVPAVEIVRADGTVTTLDSLGLQRPLLLTLVFARCVGVCPPYLRSLAEAVEAVGGAGAAYDVVVLSFDPRDTPEAMGDLAAMHSLSGARGWTFGVLRSGRESLVDAMEFWSSLDAGTGQFDHPAMTVAIDRGRVVRLLAGATVPPRRLREVVWELGGAFVGAYPLPSSDTPFRCLRYVPGSGRLQLDWGMAVLLLPGVAMFGTTAWIFRPRGRSAGRCLQHSTADASRSVS